MFIAMFKNMSFILSFIGNYRPCTPIFKKMKGRYPHYALEDSQICIEGFPRSGNTFIVATIQRWNPGIKISHHSHLASNVKYAVDHNIPTIVLIREPLEAVSSAIVWDGKLKAAIGLRGYLSFYRSLLPCLSQVMVLDFSDFTKHPDRVVQEINRKFGLRLGWKTYDVKEQKAIRRYLNGHDERSSRGLTSASLPNNEKNDLKLSIKAKLVKNRMLKVATGIYGDVLRLVDVAAEEDGQMRNQKS